MAKLTGQIKLKGTIGDLVFVEDPSKEIYVREKGKPGITKNNLKKTLFSAEFGNMELNLGVALISLEFSDY